MTKRKSVQDSTKNQRGSNKTIWPRIRDLPKKYQAPFWEHVRDKVRPLIKGIKIKDQDGY